jgi:2-methylaconitate cis-trans-isomerase PrpF
MTQIAIPCLMMRGGTSKGPYFNAKDLPSSVPARLGLVSRHGLPRRPAD